MSSVARLGPLLRSGFRRAAHTPRKPLNVAPRMTSAHHDEVEMYGKFWHEKTHTQRLLF